MKITPMIKIGLLLTLFVLGEKSGAVERGVKGQRPLQVSSTLGSPNRTHFDINRLQTSFWYDGISDYNYGRVGDAGLIYPKGSAKSAIYNAGLLWDARYGIGGEIRAGGVSYFSGLRCGKVLPGMVAEPDSLPKSRMYRVRPDIPPGNRAADVSSEKLDGEGSADEIYEQYHKDWIEWPWQDGAPFNDLNQNGSYEPDVDIPGVKGGDQTLWFVANDLNVAQVAQTWGCNPMGIEMQCTVWGYSREDALGNMLFRKYLLINKSTTIFDSMYVAMWTDPDLGNPGDDLVGCDTTRSIGFVYNGYETDIVYAPLPPPSVGFDFFQGPVVPATPSDSAIFLGKRVYGKRNLPMTAFFAFGAAPDDSYWDPDWYSPSARLPQQINYLTRGYTKDGKPWIDPAGQETKFPFSGDPATRSGWLDGQLFPPSDRRFGLASGPFTMMPGDTQEIVVAEIAAGATLGTDRLSAVSLLKFYDDQAQLAYDNFFELPTAPQAPKVTVSALDKEMVLSWGDDLEAVSKTENVTIKGYAFQGYNVYQLPSASAAVSEGKRLATFDIVDNVQKIKDRAFDPAQGEVVEVVKQFGTDSGIRRCIQLKTDAYSNNNPLVNGTPYYYAVTAYSYNPDPYAVPTTLENPIKTYTVYPHAPDPGVRYSASFGDTLNNVTHTSTVAGGALSNGRVVAQVVSPALLRQATYNVVFAEQEGQTVWHIVRTEVIKVDTVAKNMTDQTGSDSGSPMVDGLIFRVFTVSNDFQTFLTVANANGKIDPPQPGSFAFNDSEFPIGPPLDPSQDRPDGTKQQSTDLTASSGWGIHTGMNAPDMDYRFAYFKNRVTQNGARWPRIVPYDFEIRFTAKGSDALFPYDFTGNKDSLVHVPFELWNIGINTPDNTADDYQMFANILDVDSSYTFNLLTQAGTDAHDFGGGGATHSISGGANDPFTDWIYWVSPSNTAPGHGGYDTIVAQVQSDIAAGRKPYLGAGTDGDVMRRMVLVGWNFGTVASGAYRQQMPEVGTIFRILTNKPNSSSDIFTISVPGNSYSAETAKADISAINVFPNPYYGVNPLETDKYSRFVTFSHLPPLATIRIFNLAGVMVRRIDRNSTSQFERWDLKNENGLPVGSGMYIAHIEMPDLGVNKILKIAVVQEQQILDRY